MFVVETTRFVFSAVYQLLVISKSRLKASVFHDYSGLLANAPCSAPLVPDAARVLPVKMEGCITGKM